MLEFMANLCSEPSLYDSYILPDPTTGSFVLMCICLVGLGLTMFLKRPEKD